MAPRALRHKQRKYYFYNLQFRNDCGFLELFFTDRAVPVKCIFSAARRPQADSGKMSFISTTFPEKVKARKSADFLAFSIKIIVPLKMPRAKRRAF